MRFALLPFLALPALVSAHNVARQAPSPSSSGPAPTGSSVASGASHSSSSSAPAPPPAPPAGAPPAAPPAPPPPSVSWSLLSVNPTAVPLSELTSGTITTQATIPLTATYAGGAVPTYLPGAPPLPDVSTLNPANYPALDRAPPLDSPEVLQWIQDVKNSGIEIPDIAPNAVGGCGVNPQSALNASNCWWTCGGCVRDTDVTDCPDKLTWGLTYDDGPAVYTPNLLQYLDQVNLKATFFVVGSRAISYPRTLQEEYMGGHQIGVHTWSHPALTTISTEQLIAELGWSKKIIKDVTGVTPTYMRPPYGDIDDRVRAVCKAMNLTPVIWTRISPSATFDTGDFNIPGGTVSAPQVLQNWENIIGNVTTIPNGFIVLEHDLLMQMVDLATGYILPDALAFQPPLKIEPVVQCLNKPFGDAYLETNDNSSNPLPVATNAAPVTFSSGAPGAAQETKSANGSSGAVQNGTPATLNAGTSLLAAAGTAVLGLVAFASTLF